MIRKIRYKLPVAKKFIRRIARTESVAHKIYRHAIDFIVPVGTPIKAATAGIVIDVKSDGNKMGSTKKYEKFENFIEIRHDGECSYYGHLKRGGVMVKIGDRVKAGQIIGYSGATGWLANLKEPHLHFMVGKYLYRTAKFKFQK